MSGNFYTDVLLKTHLPIGVCKDPMMLEPGTRAKVLAFIADGKAAGHDLRIAETYRSQSRQRQLFAEGLTKLKNVGCHGYGVAADISLYVDGTYDPNGGHYLFFQALCVKHKLISGIGWGTPHAEHTFVDYDHVQNVPIFRQNDLFSGKFYPPPDYDPIEDMIHNGVKGV